MKLFIKPSKQLLAGGTAAVASLAAVLLGGAVYTGMLWDSNAEGMTGNTVSEQSPAENLTPMPLDMDDMINLGE